MKLYVVRHGETIENINKIMQGHIPGELSPLGISQAEKIAKRLKDTPFDIIYTSDSKRALDTAKKIHQFHSTIPLIETKELRERYFAEFEGKYIRDLDFDSIPDTAETIEMVRTRAKKCIDGIYEKHKNQIVLLVGHAGINTMILSVIKDIVFSIDQYVEQISAYKNTALSFFEFSEDGAKKIHLHNCAEHLDEK